MHSNTFYNNHQLPLQPPSLTNQPTLLVQRQTGPIDFEKCPPQFSQPEVHGCGSSSASTSSSSSILAGVRPGPRTNPHSFRGAGTGSGQYVDVTRSAGGLSSELPLSISHLGGCIQQQPIDVNRSACREVDLLPCQYGGTGPGPCTDTGNDLGLTGLHALQQQQGLCQSQGQSDWTQHRINSGYTTQGVQHQLPCVPTTRGTNTATGTNSKNRLQPTAGGGGGGGSVGESGWMADCSRPQVTSASANNCHSQFPDSPPDSGSEPYSPPNDSRRLAAAVAASVTTGTIPGSVPVGTTQSHPSASAAAAAAAAAPVGAPNNPEMAAHMYMNQHPAHRSSYNLPASHHHHHHMDPCVNVAAAAAAAGGGTGGGGPQFLTDQQPGVYCSAISRGTTGYSTAPAMYGPGPVSAESLRQMTPTMMVTHLNAQALAVQYGSMHNAASHPPKKRKYSDSPPGTLTPDLMNSVSVATSVLPVKPEPCPPDVHYGLGAGDCSEDESYSYDFAPDGGIFMDGTYQVIKWTSHQVNKWATLVDETGKDLPAPVYRVDADKGFNHAPPDDAFVCQKKNHFQITVHVGISGVITSTGCTTLPKFIRLPDESGVVPIDALYLHFYGIKMESPTQTIKIEQSQSDRSKKPFHPVRIELSPDQVTKVTVGRLHFSETTSNNMRKKGKPNPDQRYFQLVVALMAHCGADKHMLAAQASERIIVRASNPGQFENDMEALWSKGKASESVYHVGRVGVNTDSPDESLTVHGNVKVTGHVISPSDMRAKTNIQEVDTNRQLRNISQLKVYQFSYDDEFAEYAGLLDREQVETGVLAQQVQTILPDAVRETGDVVLDSGRTIDNFLVVNKDRIFIENIGAVKELCKVTDKLENRITEIEIVNKKLTKITGRGHGINSSNMKSACSHSSISISTTSSISQRDNRSTSSSVSQRTDSAAVKTNRSSSSSTRHHHSHRHGPSASTCSIAARQQEAGSGANCSNRSIHLCVIVLVAVMAVCLLSITVLYVVDRKMTSGSVPPILASQAHTYPGTSSASPPLCVPLLPLHCQTHPADCLYSCCAASTASPQYDPDDPAGTTTTFTVTELMPTSKMWWKSTRSPNDILQHLTNLDNRKTSEKPRTVLRVRRYVQDNSIAAQLRKSAFRSATTTTSTTTTAAELDNDILILKAPETHDSSAMNDPADGDDGTGRQDDAAQESPIRGKTVELRLKQLNATISSSCSINSASASGGNYTYSVPLNARFPSLPVTIQFIMKETSSAYVVALCNQSAVSQCSQTEVTSDFQAKQSRTVQYDWDLPIAFFQSSLYKFRIAALQQGQGDPCSLPRNEVNNLFLEYNLHFYRVCT